MDFSDPYFDATQALMAKKGSGITSLDDVKAKNRSAPRRPPPASTTSRSRASTPIEFADSPKELPACRAGQADVMPPSRPAGRARPSSRSPTSREVRDGRQSRHRRAVRLRREEGQHRAAARWSTRRSPTAK